MTGGGNDSPAFVAPCKPLCPVFGDRVEDVTTSGNVGPVWGFVERGEKREQNGGNPADEAVNRKRDTEDR